jgi:dipeptidyl aminopeptidase/acylaminoacyl peptidase
MSRTSARRSHGHRRHSEVWVVNTTGGEPQRWTSPNTESSNPRWSPDGAGLAFLSDRGGEDAKTQVWLMPTLGGEPRRVTDLPEGVEDYAWSPDGKRLVCEFATSEQAEALEREISRLTHPDRRPRSWADLSGTHKIDATLTAYDQKTGIVTLERADRTEITLPITKLSPADRELVELTLGSRINPRPALELGPRDPD